MTLVREFFGTQQMDVGEANFPRFLINSTSSAIGLASVRLAYWTCRKTETVGSVRTITGGTAAASLTLARIGVYSVAANGDLTLVGSTTNDTALWAATNTAYTKAFASTWVKTRGQRYATALLVQGTTAPSFHGITGVNGTGGADELGMAPRITGNAAPSGSDLPSTIAAGSVFITSVLPYSVMIPA